MVKKSVLYKKISYIKHNLSRLKEKQQLNEQEFLADPDTREVVLLNLQQAIQGCIDLGSHIVSDEGWGVPGSISEIFYKLEEHDIISPELAENLIPMAGFRNLVVHQYEEIDYKIVFVIYHERLVDIENFIDAVQVHFPV